MRGPSDPIGLRWRAPKWQASRDGRVGSVIQVGDDVLFDVSVVVERIMKEEKGMFANADFFHARAHHLMGIPTKLFTPIFVMSRITGWAAHCFEPRANNRIIRPTADYTGPADRDYVPIDNL